MHGDSTLDVEPFDPWGRQVDQIRPLDQPVFATAHLQEDGVARFDMAELIQRSPADDRLAPLHLIVLQRDFEFTVRLKHHKTLGPTLTQVERFIEPDVFEIAAGKNGEKAEAVDRFAAGGGDDLTAQGHGVRQRDGTKLQAFVAHFDAVRPGRPEWSPLAHRGADVFDIAVV